MTDELTLREKALLAIEREVWVDDCGEAHDFPDALNAIAAILEDTGSPAHMRVAAELRGE